tara:strand:+ start:11691 stop:12629 length:939 start_codon:yes stop_codon:yes gene_type:complete
MPNLTMLEPKSLTEAMQFSETLAKSGLVPDAYKGKPQNILVAIQWGYEVGLPPMQALSNINVINGKATLWGDALVAVCKKHPDYYGMKEWLEGDTAFCIVKRKVKDTVEETLREFSLEDATKAGLLNKGGAWKSYPKRMLAQRARGFALRDAFPDAIKGIITTEEAVDFPDEAKTSDIKVVNPPIITNDADLANSIVNALTDDNTAENDTVEQDEQTVNVSYELKLLNNKPSETFDEIDNVVKRYKEIMSAVYASPKLQPEEKRTMLKDFEHINLELIMHNFPEKFISEVKQQRLDFNKALSLQAKENQNGQ